MADSKLNFESAMLAVVIHLIAEVARSLLKLKQKVDTEKVGNPSKLLIITASGYGYERPDGTTVLPITAIAP